MKKRVFTIFLISLFTILGKAQAADSLKIKTPKSIENVQEEIRAKHKIFKNIEITGTPSEVAKNLKKQGFTANTNGTFFGELAGFAVMLTPTYTPTSNILYKLDACISSDGTWTTGKKIYTVFKENLTKKYGTPSLIKERFYSPYIEGDGFEVKAFKVKKAEYISVWICEDGEICDYISNGSDVHIVYTDQVNEEICKKEQNDIYMKEL